MKKLAIAVIVAALAWSGFWFVSAHFERKAIDSWMEARRTEGWTATYDDLTIKGFPNRMDARLSGLVLASPDGLRWEAPFVDIYRLVYNFGHEILAFPPQMTVTTEMGETQVASDGMRASFIHEGDTVVRANFESQTLNLTGATTAALAGLTAALTRDEDAETSYRIAVGADAIAGSGGRVADAIRLDAGFDTDLPLRVGQQSGPHPQPTRVDLRLAEYKVDDLQLKVAGEVDVDDRGRMDGEVTVKAVNWREMIAMAQQSGQLPENMAQMLEDGLGLIAGLSGNRETLDLPLTLDEGRARLGPIPLGEAPRLRFP
ncbi:hypothetical protein AYJ57_08990 [Salipiger sp. CCB-MM3]|uniref:DUF2125 domain-containing protein n=1 Tax=Salipiger sp. CCB-MM3 TaxID=1792508 RepID=UPI00080AAE51|nr:DUF2125 domain-containing protein [Salipiger sp. CCB-MM3]ANT60484.1 hypothetical protein AYJ57_08990 [Salipiger sp. CCB-MM3]